RGDTLVMIMRGAGVSLRVALQADLVAGEFQLGAMRIVAIAAGHANRIHLALLERTVIIHLVDHLPVGLVEALGERSDEMRIGERPPRHPAFGDLSAPRMAETAALDLLAQARRHGAPHRSCGLGIVAPGHAGSLVEAHEQPLVRIVVLVRPPARLVLGPGDMPRALAVAG